MVIHTCITCEKIFDKKSTYAYHIKNKKNPCNTITILSAPKDSGRAPKDSKIAPKDSNIINIILNNDDKYNNETIKLKNKDDIDHKNIIFCIYCDKTFTRNNNLQRHLTDNRCKSKNNYDELEILKEKMNIIITNYQKLENNYQKIENENADLKKKIDEIEIIQKGCNINNDPKIINNFNKTINNNSNKQINKGLILNNTVNVQVVQFGNEDIDKLNLVDAMKTYLKSTGGNIASNMLNYINLNKDYPENNNICITDLSREIVKIHNGEKFVYKKFKNVKDEILTKIIKNTRKFVNKYENDESLKKSTDTKNKLKINDISLKIIDGISAEDIVREDIKEKEKHLIKNINVNKIQNTKNKLINGDDSESEVERDFTLEERLKIEHLDNKRDGMQKKTFENIKDRLYNAKELMEKINT